MDDRASATVLAGWLGSGKTTLLNELLACITGERVAVIVNDIGDINVDAALIRRFDGDRIELTDGCVCCSIGSSLALTLRDLMATDNPPDRIIIEASGVAEPERIAAYGDRRRIESPTIIVTVDATDVLDRSRDPRYGTLVRAQIAQAESIVLTKLDLVDDHQRDRVAQWLQAEAPFAPLLDRDRALRQLCAGRAGALGPGRDVDRPERPRYGESPSASGAEFTTQTITFDRQVDLDALGRELDVTPGLLRAKGLLGGPDGSFFTVHYSARRFEVSTPPDRFDPGAAHRLVVIGAVDEFDPLDLERRLRLAQL